MLVIVVAAAAFALSSPASVVALKALSISSVVALRCLIAFFALALIVRGELKRAWSELDSKSRGLVIAAGVAFCLHLIFFVAGLDHTSYAAAVILVALEPIAVIGAGAFVYGARPTLGQSIGILFTICGAVATAFNSAAPSGSGAEALHHLSGDLFIVAAVVLYGAYYSLTRALGSSAHPRRDLALSAMVYAIALMLALIVVAFEAMLGSPIVRASVVDVPALTLALLTLGLVPTLIGHTLVQRAARTVAPALVGLVSPGETFGSLMIGVLALGAWPTMPEAVGAGLILGGSVIVALCSRSK